MTSLPKFASKDRVTDAVLVVLCGVAQATALAVATFATRDAFTALHAGTVPATTTLASLAGAGIVAAIALLLSRQRSEALGQSYAIALRRIIYAHLAGMPKTRHAARRVGALSLRFVGDLSAARLWFGRGLPRVLSALIVLPGAACILFLLSPQLALSGIVPIAAALILMAGVALHLEARHAALRKKRARIAISMTERIAISPELDLMGRTQTELKLLDADGAVLRDNALARMRRISGLQAILQGGVALAGVATFWAAGTYGVATGTTAAALSLLALLAMPLQDLGEAWDQFCAWRIAREKAERLLSEDSSARRRRRRGGPVALDLRGKTGDGPLELTVPAGETVTLQGALAPRLGAILAGLDRDTGWQVLYGDDPRLPVCLYIGDTHVALQGTLRRSATLLNRKRPKDDRIREELDAFGLGHLCDRLGGLRGTVGEAGRNMSPTETLRLDLVRAVLGRAELIVIDSVRWRSDPEAPRLLALLRERLDTTLVCVDADACRNDISVSPIAATITQDV
ncbi:ABC transporter transmembrane domain-containing protein [Aestuariibius sp. 2305UL40-4]|uniref:ABC transporter transmembrane domain-containing protein n=1 Tax=Aestuariibius violaceus TaxID=3234132 RepID=UPI00345EB16A